MCLFSNMDDEKLIASVRARSFIYTKSDKNHSNRDMISAAWENIAREVGGDGNLFFSTNVASCTKISRLMKL